MHILTTKIAFSLEEVFNYLQQKDPLIFGKVYDLICDYAEELYEDYPGAKLSKSPITEGLRFKPCGVPVFFETSSSHNSDKETSQSRFPIDHT